ncbi:cation/H(+) antiporter 18-like [Hibiscus syriacus]|uniref:cation/H(+) antiporter 18-like n=1 Tax=Hibiscus syriacus TaxID=106335 RepID=UPI001920E4C6|nr:cation/H(+) antiporter 18-like [Hibiscus syriacus]
MGSTTHNAMDTPPAVCVHLNKTQRYNAIFWKPNHSDAVLSTLMLQIILSVVVTRTLHVILRPLKQSKIVCSILVSFYFPDAVCSALSLTYTVMESLILCFVVLQAGVILGPSVLGRNKAYSDKMFGSKELLLFYTVSTLAAYLYVFVACIKMDVAMINRAAPHTRKLSLFCLILPFTFVVLLTNGIGKFMPGRGAGNGLPIHFCFVYSISYFIVVTQALDELNLLSSELGQLSSSITMINEFVSGVFIIIGVATEQKGTRNAIYCALSFCSLIPVAVFFVRPIFRRIINRTPKGKPVEERYVIAVILMTFIMGFITDFIGASCGTAFMIMGFTVPDGPPLGMAIVRKCELIVFDVLLPLFFFRIGYHTDLSAIRNWKELVIFGSLVVVEYLGRLIACLLFSSSLKMKERKAVLLSLILSLQGVVQLFQSIRWQQQKLIDDQTYTTIVMGIVVVNAIITPLIEVFLQASGPRFRFV